jgi:hypothetical protein
MLKPQPLANAFAAASVIFYLALIALKLVAPPLFKLILNSQFLGADIASQVPSANLANLLGFLIAIAVFAWFFGYLVALFYNRFSK